MKNLTRRRFLQESSLLMGAALVPSPLLAQQKKTSLQSVHRFSVGQVQCSVLKDFALDYETGMFFSEPSPEIEEQYDAYDNIHNGTVHSPYSAMLLRMNDQNILLDTGIGYHQNPVSLGDHQVEMKGQLQSLLQEENLGPEDVDMVIISHFHPDHIGGIYTEEGKLNFPQAEIVVDQQEWDFWHSEEGQNLMPLFTDFIRENIHPLDKSTVRFLQEDYQNVVPGITAIQAPGHTPGHRVLIIESGGEKLLYAADTFLHPIHVENLSVQTVFDYDPQQARKSREKVLNIAEEEDALVHAFHFAYPGLGRVARKGSQWLWEYTDQTASLNTDR